MRPAGWCQPKGRIGAAPGATEPMGERGKCLYTLKNTSKSRRSAQNTKKSISNSNNEPNFTLHEISGLGPQTSNFAKAERALSNASAGRAIRSASKSGGSVASMPNLADMPSTAEGSSRLQNTLGTTNKSVSA